MNIEKRVRNIFRNMSPFDCFHRGDEIFKSLGIDCRSYYMDRDPRNNSFARYIRDNNINNEICYYISFVGTLCIYFVIRVSEKYWICYEIEWKSVSDIYLHNMFFVNEGLTDIGKRIQEIKELEGIENNILIELMAGKTDKECKSIIRQYIHQVNTMKKRIEKEKREGGENGKK